MSAPPIRVTVATIRDTARRMRDHLDAIERDAALLIARAHAERPDGYPTSSTSGGGRSAGTNDPTARAAFIRYAAGAPTTGQSTAAQALAWLELAAVNLRDANDARARALPPPPADDRTAWCASCLRGRGHDRRPLATPATRETGGRSGLCRFCYGWQTDNGGAWPPVALIEAHVRDGRRLTTRLVDELTRPAKAGRR